MPKHVTSNGYERLKCTFYSVYKLRQSDTSGEFFSVPLYRVPDRILNHVVCRKGVSAFLPPHHFPEMKQFIGAVTGPCEKPTCLPYVQECAGTLT